jgi:hypothetical protein
VDSAGRPMPFAVSNAVVALQVRGARPMRWNPIALLELLAARPSDSSREGWRGPPAVTPGRTAGVAAHRTGRDGGLPVHAARAGGSQARGEDAGGVDRANGGAGALAVRRSAPLSRRAAARSVAARWRAEGHAGKKSEGAMSSRSAPSLRSETTRPQGCVGRCPVYSSSTPGFGSFRCLALPMPC